MGYNITTARRKGGMCKYDMINITERNRDLFRLDNIRHKDSQNVDLEINDGSMAVSIMPLLLKKRA